ncbi:MAG: response regulator [Lachnospiraceae bacterium]
MDLLKLVIVDDEPILLKGLISTYEWDKMGFQVVGSAQSGEQAVEVINRLSPDVVLTDIRMKQMTGLQVMEQVRKTEKDCLFIVLSAYRDFSYAQQACDLGAFAYLLKPIEDEKLQETMQNAYKTCMEQRKNAQKYENWEKIVRKDATNFLQVVVQKYLQDQIPFDKMKEVFETVEQISENEDRFITVNTDIDIAYKITNALNYEAVRYALETFLTEKIGKRYFFWHFTCEEGSDIFIVRTRDNATVRELKHLLEQAKEEQKSPIVASISKPYKGLMGIRRSYEEARKLFKLSAASGGGTFTIREEMGERCVKNDATEEDLRIINALRKNDAKALKEAFVHFIYVLPAEEELQRQKMHAMMLKAEVTIEDTYGMTGEVKEQFKNYYCNMQNLNASKEVDVCYRILGKAIEERIAYAESHEITNGREYMTAALAYMEEHLQEEDLSIVSVATHIYLNPVYFGRVFKENMHMSFKKYLLQCRMEKAKKLLQNGTDSIGSICEQTGIGNPSYFSHLFKEYTGKLPSEYKKEFDV